MRSRAWALAWMLLGCGSGGVVSADASISDGAMDAPAMLDAAIDAQAVDADVPASCGSTVVIQDDFDGLPTDPAWSSYAHEDLTLTEADSRLQIHFPETTVGPQRYATYQTATDHDLTGGCVTVDVAVVPDVTTDALAYFKIIAGTNQLEMITFGGILYARLREDGALTVLGMTPYDSTAHRFWRFREDDGVALYEVSSDGVAFSGLAELTSPPSLVSSIVEIGAGTFKEETDPGGAQYEWVSIRVP